MVYDSLYIIYCIIDFAFVYHFIWSKGLFNINSFDFMLIGSFMVCIVLVTVFSTVELYLLIQIWVTDIHNRITIFWMDRHATYLYTCCLIFANAFTALTLFNSSLFGKEVFRMGITHHQMANTQIKVYVKVLYINICDQNVLICLIIKSSIAMFSICLICIKNVIILIDW